MDFRWLEVDSAQAEAAVFGGIGFSAGGGGGLRWPFLGGWGFSAVGGDGFWAWHYLLLANFGSGDCCWPILVELALAEVAGLGAVGSGCRCRFWEDGIQRRRRCRLLGGGFI